MMNSGKLNVYILGLSGRPFFIVVAHYPTGVTHMRNGSTRQKHFALSVCLKLTKLQNLNIDAIYFIATLYHWLLKLLWWNVGKM